MDELLLNSTECMCGDLQAANYTVAYRNFNLITIMIGLPFMTLTGIIGNIINFYIYTLKNMRQHSANVYLAALSLSDVFLVLNGILLIWTDSARSYFPVLLRNGPYLPVYVLPFGMLVQTYSVYVIVVAAVDCYVQVSYPPNQPSRYCTPRVAVSVLLFLLLSCILYNTPRIGQMKLRECLSPEGSETLEICPTQHFFNVNVIYNVYMYTVFMSVLPFVLLLGLTAAIMIFVKRRPHDPNDQSTVTMLMIIILFLVCNTLALIVNIVETFFNPETVLLNYMVDASNFLVIFNACVNVFIYYIYSTEYRIEFRKLVCPSSISAKPMSASALVDVSGCDLTNTYNCHHPDNGHLKQSYTIETSLALNNSYNNSSNSAKQLPCDAVLLNHHDVHAPLLASDGSTTTSTTTSQPHKVTQNIEQQPQLQYSFVPQLDNGDVWMNIDDI